MTDALQRRVLADAGVPERRMAAALFALRAASQLFPHDAELAAIPLYVRHNHATAGTLRSGDQLPELPLHTLQPTGATTSLRASCAGPLPTLLVAGSWT